MYRLLLDTADIDAIKEGLDKWPISGVTSNPSILKREGKIDVYGRLKEIKKVCGVNRDLHVQVVSDTTEGIINEAHCILEKLGNDVCIKIPVSKAGLPAIKKLSEEGVTVTATTIFFTFQGILAVLAGAKYIAIYYNRMQNNCSNPNMTIREIREFIDKSGSDAKILAASFRNIAQVTDAYANGAQCATVDPSIIESEVGMAAVQGAVDSFAKDFTDVNGEGQDMTTV